MSVTVYDRMPSVGRKLLMAGRGGLNLTHSEDSAAFLRAVRRGRAASASGHRGLSARSAPRAGARVSGRRPSWDQAAGCSPKPSRPRRCCAPGCAASKRAASPLRCGIAGRVGTRPAPSVFDDAAGESVADRPDAVVLALGGASWPRLGSDGAWVPFLEARGVAIAPPASGQHGRQGRRGPTSCAAGSRAQPLKRIALTFGGVTVRGEAMVTADGLEGGAVYALSAPLRDAIERDGEAILSVDLRPDLTLQSLVEPPGRSRGKANPPRPSCARPPVCRPLGIALLREGDAASADRSRGPRPRSSRPRPCA